MVRWYGCYDGHGSFGKDASQMCSAEVEKCIRANVRKIIKMREDIPRVKKFLVEMFLTIQLRFKKNTKMYDQSGTTAVCILQIENELFIANIGDSRAVMCNIEGGEISAMELSNDHKPYNPIEKERIERSGGDVAPKEGTMGPLRVWRRDEESPGLAVTRTMGDLVGHKIGVSSEPEVEYWKLMPEDYFIVLGSDGIWDVMSSAEVVGYIIRECEDIKKSHIELAQTARSLWEYQNNMRRNMIMKQMLAKSHIQGKQVMQQIKEGAVDDITAVVVILNPRFDKSSLLRETPA